MQRRPQLRSDRRDEGPRTERIDSALIANWKLHNVLTQEEIEDAVRETARIVDEQNADNSAHLPMTDTQEKRDNLMQDPAVIAVLEIIEEALSSTQRLR